MTTKQFGMFLGGLFILTVIYSFHNEAGEAIAGLCLIALLINRAPSFKNLLG